MVLVVKNFPANAGDIRDSGSIPGLGRFPGGGHGTILQYFAWEIPWTEKLAGYSPWGHEELDMTEVTQHMCRHLSRSDQRHLRDATAVAIETERLQIYESKHGD